MNGLSPLLLRVGPLALGAAISPVVLLCQMLVLTSGTARVARAWCFAAGTLASTAVWMTVGYFAFHGAAQSSPRAPQQANTSGVVHLVIAALFLVLAVKNFSQPEKDVDPHAADSTGDSPGFVKAFLFGVVIMAGNVTTFALLLPAMHDVATSRSSTVAVTVACALLALGATAPATVPPLVVTLGGDRGRNDLDRLAGSMHRHRNKINAVVCLAFALYLGVTGLTRLR